MLSVWCNNSCKYSQWICIQVCVCSKFVTFPCVHYSKFVIEFDVEAYLSSSKSNQSVINSGANDWICAHEWENFSFITYIIIRRLDCWVESTTARYRPASVNRTGKNRILTIIRSETIPFSEMMQSFSVSWNTTGSALKN